MIPDRWVYGVLGICTALWIATLACAWVAVKVVWWIAF